jgi:hypothetical protein
MSVTLIVHDHERRRERSVGQGIYRYGTFGDVNVSVEVRDEGVSVGFGIGK